MECYLHPNELLQVSIFDMNATYLLAHLLPFNFSYADVTKCIPRNVEILRKL